MAEWVRLPFLSEDMTLKMAKMFALTSASRVTYKMEIHQHLVRTGHTGSSRTRPAVTNLGTHFHYPKLPSFFPISFIHAFTFGVNTAVTLPFRLNFT